MNGHQLWSYLIECFWREIHMYIVGMIIRWSKCFQTNSNRTVKRENWGVKLIKVRQWKGSSSWDIRCKAEQLVTTSTKPRFLRWIEYRQKLNSWIGREIFVFSIVVWKIQCVIEDLELLFRITFLGTELCSHDDHIFAIFLQKLWFPIMCNSSMTRKIFHFSFDSSLDFSMKVRLWRI